MTSKSNLSMTINSSITALHLSVSMFLSWILKTFTQHIYLMKCLRCGLKVRRSRPPGFFEVLMYALLESWLIWRIYFILGLNTTHEVTICLPSFSCLQFRGHDRVFCSFKCTFLWCPLHGHVPIWPWPRANLTSQFWPSPALTNLPLVLHTCVIESGQHWFR